MAKKKMWFHLWKFCLLKMHCRIITTCQKFYTSGTEKCCHCLMNVYYLFLKMLPLYLPENTQISLQKHKAKKTHCILQTSMKYFYEWRQIDGKQSPLVPILTQTGGKQKILSPLLRIFPLLENALSQYHFLRISKIKMSNALSFFKICAPGKT